MIKNLIALVFLVIIIIYLKDCSSPEGDLKRNSIRTSTIQKVTGGPWVGCVTKELKSDIQSYVTANDIVGFRRAAAQKIETGQCTLFKAGDVVYTVENAIFLVKLRRLGETRAFWTNREALH